MFLWKRSSTSLLVISLVMSFASCNHEKHQGVGGQQAVTPITVSIGPTALCVQNGVEGGKVLMDNNGVSWSGLPPNGMVIFGSTVANCPVSPPPNGNCSFVADNNGNVSTGPATGSSGTKFTISNVTNNAGQNYCTAQGDGLIMK